MSQGKAWDKKKVIEVLKPYFKLGCSVTKACKYAGIAQSTVQTWIDADEDLRLKVTAWRNEVNELARKEWKKAIEEGRPTNSGPDRYTPAKEWLERVEKEQFSTKKEVELGGDPITELRQSMKHIKEEIENDKK